MSKISWKKLLESLKSKIVFFLVVLLLNTIVCVVNVEKKRGLCVLAARVYSSEARVTTASSGLSWPGERKLMIHLCWIGLREHGPAVWKITVVRLFELSTCFHIRRCCHCKGASCLQTKVHENGHRGCGLAKRFVVTFRKDAWTHRLESKKQADTCKCNC